MGVGIYLIFQARVDGAEFDSDGKVLAAEFELLDELSQKAGGRPFTSFGDNREVPAGFDGDPDELAVLLGEFNEWFSSAEGIRTVDAILAELSDHTALIEDLKELRRCLQLAAEKGVAFRLDMA